MGKFQLNKKGEDPLKIYEDVFKIANDTVETHLGKLGKMPNPISSEGHELDDQSSDFQYHKADSSDLLRTDQRTRNPDGSISYNNKTGSDKQGQVGRADYKESKASEYWEDDGGDQDAIADGLADLQSMDNLYCKVCGKDSYDHRSEHPQSWGDMSHASNPDMGTGSQFAQITDHAFVLDYGRLNESKASEGYEGVCPVCNGKGEVDFFNQISGDDDEQMCDDCQGTGQKWVESKASEARKLNARQKKLIEEWVGSMSSPPMMITSDDLPYSLLSELRDINDFDGFDSAIMRYASDIGNKQAMQGSNPYMHSSNYGSFESRASEGEFKCPKCKFETDDDDAWTYHMDDHDEGDSAVSDFMKYEMESLASEWKSVEVIASEGNTNHDSSNGKFTSGSSGGGFSKDLKSSLRKDAKSNQDLYGTPNFDPSSHVDADVYTNLKDNGVSDDEIISYIEGLKLDPNKRGNFMKDNYGEAIASEFSLKEYKDNEDINYHAENALELVKQYGTSDEIERIEDIVKMHNDKGYLSIDERSERDSISRKYYSRLVNDASQEERDYKSNYWQDTQGESKASEGEFKCPKCKFETNDDDKMQYHMEDHDFKQVAVSDLLSRVIGYKYGIRESKASEWKLVEAIASEDDKPSWATSTTTDDNGNTAWGGRRRDLELWPTDEDEARARAKWNPDNKCGMCGTAFDSVEELKKHSYSLGPHYPSDFP